VLLLAEETATATERATEAVELHRELGDDWGVAYSLFLLGHIAFERQEWEVAHDSFTASIGQFAALGDDHFRLLATLNLAWVYGELGERERARPLLDDGLREARATGNKRLVTAALVAKAADEEAQGRYAEALEMLREAFEIAQETGEHVEIPYLFNGMASVLAAAGRHVAAARLLAKAAALNEEARTRARAWNEEQAAKALATVEAALNEEAFARAWDEGLALSEDEAVEQTLDT
jgi:tetratricopeptide (TPR) repeat protein